MKKLMFAIAAVAAGTVLADVTSANVVGYENNVVTNGAQGAGAAFIAVSGTMKMGDLKIVGGDGYTPGDYWKAGISCYQINRYGLAIEQMYWYDDGYSYGWWDIDGYLTEYNDNVLPSAVGLIVQITDDANYQLQSSGQVLDEPYAITLTNGAQFVCNPTPVDVPMGKIRITGGDGYTPGDYWKAGISCYQINRYGLAIEQMYWYDDGYSYGWWDIDGYLTEYNDRKLPKGAGLAFQITDDSSYTLEFPSTFDVND